MYSIMGQQSRTAKRTPGLDRIEIQFTKEPKTQLLGDPPVSPSCQVGTLLGFGVKDSYLTSQP